MDLVRLFELVKMGLIICALLGCFALLPLIIDEFSDKVKMPKEKKEKRKR